MLLLAELLYSKQATSQAKPNQDTTERAEKKKIPSVS